MLRHICQSVRTGACGHHCELTTSRASSLIERHLSISSVSSSSSTPAPEVTDGDKAPVEARAVIGGGGVIGCSVAYYLAKAGWKDIVLLEQGSLSCGSSWSSTGICGALRSSPAEVAICQHSLKLYKQLHDEGHDIGFKQVGSLNLSRTSDRSISYKRNLLIAQRFDVEGSFLSPSEIKSRVPLLHTEDLLGGTWVPGDALVNSEKLTKTLAKKAQELGVRIIEQCQIRRILTKNRRVTTVETNRGFIECQTFINCAGIWGRELGKLSSPTVRVPLHPCEHMCVISKPLAGVSPDMPAIRDYDGYIYMREWNGGILGAGYEPIAKPAMREGIPDKFEFKLLPEDWDHFQGTLEQLLHRMPDLASVEAQKLVNAPEGYTPDCKYIMGRVPELTNYYVAAGMNGTGIAAAGGVGRYLAEWIVDGEPSLNMWSLDVQRFAELHNNRRFLKERVTESLSMVAHIPYWEADMIGYDSGRRLRTSAIFTRNEPFAVFGQSMGYERPLYFHSDSENVDEDVENVWQLPKPVPSLHGIKTYEHNKTGLPQKGTFGKPVWFEKVKSEYWACREGVCLIDMSTFSKFEFRSGGDEAIKFLQYVCSNDIDKSVGSVIHTGIQNHNGGFENDCSVIRLADNRFFMVSPTAQQIRSFAWLREHLPQDGSVQLSDVTSMYTAINVIGPKAQELLSELTDTPLGKKDFPHMTCKEIHIGMASHVKAMRLTHTGEDGWCLYIPSEYALHVYDALLMAGKNYGVRSAGYYALRALRTEKFFAYWGTDLLPQNTPLECGREFRVKFDLGGFIGYPALVRQKSEGIRRRLVQFLIEDHNIDEDSWPWSGEPIYRNGVYCGLTTSTAYGFSLDKHICLGYVSDFDEKSGEPGIITNDFVLKGGAKFEINIAGKLFPAKAHIYPPKLPSPASLITPAAAASAAE